MQGTNDIFVSALQRLLMQLSARAIALDPHTARELRALAGQVVEIHCLEPDLRWHLRVAEEHIDFATGPAEQPNVALTGSAKGLLQTLITGSSADGVAIDGEATLLMQLQTLAKNFSPDLVRPLTNVVGTDKAQRTAALLELGAATLCSMFNAAALQTQESAESFMTQRFTTDPEVENFLTRVDQLRLRVDRLQARLTLHGEPSDAP